MSLSFGKILTFLNLPLNPKHGKLAGQGINAQNHKSSLESQYRPTLCSEPGGCIGAVGVMMVVGTAGAACCGPTTCQLLHSVPLIAVDDLILMTMSLLSFILFADYKSSVRGQVGSS